MGLAGIKSLSEISSNIVTWFSANDINLPIGSTLTTLAGREGKDSVSVIVGGYTLQLDSEGYKCIRTTGTTHTCNCNDSVTTTNNETFIGVVNSKGNYQIASPYHEGTSIAISTTSFSYANFTVGNGRVLYPFIGNKKRIITGVFTPAAMLVYEGLTLVATLLNPTQLTRTSVGGVFRGDANSTNVEVDYYHVVRIQEALSGEKLRQAIRSVAYEHGVKV